ncbi:hypothetical protein Poly30_45160 [Planctomycetes bacterium Poly30]|uniref:Uncharacterized protein n=1 Tax=Saltatorellus ferox TaxID=2528018 RepID=A0A518EXZ1_9BACT|nr:hypothetical protein Poly30_45160 [Planctomycetes bacterium Poly30]
MRLPASTHRFHQAHWVLRPVVLAVLVYGTLLRFASLYFLATLRFPEVGGDPDYGSGWDRLGSGLTILNLLLAGLLARELHLSRRRDATLRRAHFAGALLGLVYLGSLQWLIFRAPDVFTALLPATHR